MTSYPLRPDLAVDADVLSWGFRPPTFRRSLLRSAPIPFFASLTVRRKAWQ